MFAAFELKKRVSEALKPVPVTTSLAMVLKALEKVWQPKLDATKPASPAAFKGFPKLTQIFDFRVVAGAWKVDFTSRGSIASLGTNARPSLPLQQDRWEVRVQGTAGAHGELLER